MLDMVRAGQQRIETTNRSSLVESGPPVRLNLLCRRQAVVLIGSSLGTLLAGCDPPHDVVHQAMDETNEVELILADPDKLAIYLTRYQGSVVLVTFWGTWSQESVELLPAKLLLGAKYADQGLVIITVALDDAEHFGEARRALFEQHAERFINLISRLGMGAESLEAFEVDGGIPFTKLYDRTGEVRYRFGQDERELTGRIEELLAEADPGELTPEEEEQINRILGK